MRKRKKQSREQIELAMEKSLAVERDRPGGRDGNHCITNRRHTVVIAFDPGESGGWAVWSRTGYVDSGTYDGDDCETIASLIDEYKPDLVVVEDQFQRRTHKRKASSFGLLKILVCRRAYVEACAKLAGVEHVAVMPRTWMSYAQVPAGQHDAYIKAARYMTGDHTIQSDDRAAACLMALWAVSQPA